MLLGSTIARLFQIIYVIFVVRLLGPQDYGLLALVLAVTGVITSVIDPHVGLATVKLYTEKQDQHFLYIALIFYICVGVASAVVILLFGDIVIANLAGSQASERRFDLVLIFISLLIILITTNSLYSTLFESFFLFSYEALMIATRRILICILAVVALFWGYGLLGVFAAIIAGYLIPLIILMPIAYEILKAQIKTRIRVGILWSKFVEVLQFGILAYIATVMYQFYTSSDVILVGYFRSLWDVGQYSAALRLVNVVLLIPSAFISVLMPVVSRISGEKTLSEREISSIVGLTLKYTMILAVPFCMVLSANSFLVITSLFGISYQYSTEVLPLLSIFAILLASYIVFDSTLVGLGKLIERILVSLTMLICGLILHIVLIPTIGIYGAALSMLLSAGIGTLSAMFALRLTPSNLLAANVAKFAIALTPLALSSLIATTLMNSLAGICLLTISLAGYALLLLLLGVIDEKDLDNFSKVSMLSPIAKFGKSVRKKVLKRG